MSSIMIKLSAESGSVFMGIKTYDRLHGSHGRFLIARDSLAAMLGDPQGVKYVLCNCSLP